tara:strand:+ start:220 stop:456 length:237 start_codon:yes stop_codon:yes gene_type:complete
MTFDELQELENWFSDIRHARDQLESRGYNVGGYTLNSITDAQRSMLPNEEDCGDYPKEEKKLKEGELDHHVWAEYFKL